MCIKLTRNDTRLVIIMLIKYMVAPAVPAIGLNKDIPLPIAIGNIKPVEKNIIALATVMIAMLVFTANESTKKMRSSTNNALINMDMSRMAWYFFNKKRQIKVDAKKTIPKPKAKCPKNIGP